MRAIPIVGIAALALAACQAAEEEPADNTMADVTAIGEEDAATTDPALTDLNIESGSGEVDQAVNQADSQSNLDRAIEDAGNSIDNQI